MALGAYSLVRFTDNVSDQRLNLGIIVWHPVAGLKFRISPSVDRVHAIDPTILIQPLRAQLDVIKEQLSEATGQDVLTQLSNIYKEGLEVASPYPARIQSADETLERLYQALVSPVPEIRRAGSQQQFASRVKSSLKQVAAVHAAQFEDIGVKRFGRLVVNVGLRTIADHRKLLWHALSLQSVDQPERQLAVAKATAMDIDYLENAPDYKGHTHYVTVQAPKARASERVKDAVAWLENAAEKVWVVDGSGDLPSLFEEAFGRRRRAATG